MNTSQPALFATTRWSLVRAAGSGQGDEALEELCRIYWMPVYAVVRRSGKSPDDAKDLTQGFFALLLERGSFAGADDSRGRFRAWLLTALKRHLTDEWRREHRVKRGGFQEIVPLDAELAERLYLVEGQGTSPDEIFDRRWAVVLLERAMNRLAEEYRGSGRLAEHDHLLPCLTAGRGETEYAGVAAALGITEGAARVAVHRLRKRFRSLVREEVGRTVATSGEIDEEMSLLMQALGR